MAKTEISQLAKIMVDICNFVLYGGFTKRGNPQTLTLKRSKL
jgi:hypothetical protein